MENNYNNCKTQSIQNDIPQATLSEEAKASFDNTNHTQDSSKVDVINNIYAELSVSYDDPTVLSTRSEDLDNVNSYFNKITKGDTEIETLLYEVIGYAVAKTAKLNKAFIFKGNGRNGKSKVFRILEALLGEEQCSHEHLEQLSGSKSGSKSTIKLLENCTVNIAEDQKQPKYINNSLITRVISGEPISIEQKGGKDNFILKPYATMLFSVNEVIDFKETGIYITDRFVVIPFNETFTDDKDNRDINIEEKLRRPLALQIIATKATQSFDKVLENGKFTILKSVENETKNYFMDCNNVAEFCRLYPIKIFIYKSRYFEEYCKWCNINNMEAVSNSQFGKRVLELGYTDERYSFGGNRNTYYANITFDNSGSRIVFEEYLSYVGKDEETIRKYNACPALYTKYETITFSDYLCKFLYDDISDIKKDSIDKINNLIKNS